MKNIAPIFPLLIACAVSACSNNETGTDAGGDTDEENAACYLQIEWAAVLPNVGRSRICMDMDGWGYSFRLGSAAAWFEQDAADARQWLLDHGVLGAQGQLTYACR
jgi:hypothetical protein